MVKNEQTEIYYINKEILIIKKIFSLVLTEGLKAAVTE